MDFYEAQIHALVVRSRAIATEVISMQAHDQSAQSAGTGPYAEEAYLTLAKELYVIHDEIQHIARTML